MRGSEYCFQHDPELEEVRQALLAGQSRGAGVPIISEAVSLKTPADVRALLEKALLCLATGQRVDPRRITALNGTVDRLLPLMAVTGPEAELAAAQAEIQRLQERCAELERDDEPESRRRRRPAEDALRD
jgi:hypothetical protein